MAAPFPEARPSLSGAAACCCSRLVASLGSSHVEPMCASVEISGFIGLESRRSHMRCRREIPFTFRLNRYSFMVIRQRCHVFACREQTSSLTRSPTKALIG